MKKILAAIALVISMLPPGSTVTAHHRDRAQLKLEARLFSHVVGQPQDFNVVGPQQPTRHRAFCGPFGEAGRGVFDKDISCDSVFAPDNELAIAVHPTNPNLLLAGSNDYQLQFVGVTVILHVPSGWFFSSDGGRTWTDGQLPLKGSLGGGDPVPEFDLKDQFSIPVVAPNGDLFIHFHNEQNLAAYELPQRYDSQIMIVKSTDGGDTFAGETPAAVNQAGCVRQIGAARGTPAPGFPNPCIVPIHVIDMEDSYDNFSQAGDAPEGATAIPDYPINADGRTTLTGHQFRINSAGNIAAGRAPGASGYRLWVTFADNCAGVRPGPGATQEDDPDFVPITDTNIYYAYSDDGGLTWIGGDGVDNGRPGNSCSTPAGLATRRLAHFDRFAMSDQWFPWSDTDSAGNLHVGFMDGDVADGPVRKQYGFSNTTVTLGNAVSATLVVSSVPSEPDRSVFFRRECPDEPLETCASFIGDYNGLAVDSNDQVHSAWTDMRRPVATFGTPAVAVNTQDAFYAKAPTPPGP